MKELSLIACLFASIAIYSTALNRERDKVKELEKQVQQMTELMKLQAEDPGKLFRLLGELAKEGEK